MLQQLLKSIVGMSRIQKAIFIAAVDLVSVIVAIWAAFSLRLDVLYIPPAQLLWIFLLAPLLAIPIFIRFGLYHAIIRYIGFQALWAVTQAVALYSLLWFVVVLLSGVEGVPRSVYLLNLILSMLFVWGSRMSAYWLFAPQQSNQGGRLRKRKCPVVIYGAGNAGIQLASALTHSQEQRAVAFIDDDKRLHKQRLSGLKIHPFRDLSHLIDKMGVQEVLLAMPSASHSRRREIISMLEPYPVHVRTLPGMAAIAQGEVKR